MRDLSKLFDIASPEEDSKMRKDRLLGNKQCKEDLRFITDQRSNHHGSMSSKEKINEDKVEIKEARELKEKEREEVRKIKSERNTKGCMILMKIVLKEKG